MKNDEKLLEKGEELWKITLNQMRKSYEFKEETFLQLECDKSAGTCDIDEGIEKEFLNEAFMENHLRYCSLLFKNGRIDEQKIIELLKKILFKNSKILSEEVEFEELEFVKMRIERNDTNIAPFMDPLECLREGMLPLYVNPKKELIILATEIKDSNSILNMVELAKNRINTLKQNQLDRVKKENIGLLDSKLSEVTNNRTRITSILHFYYAVINNCSSNRRRENASGTFEGTLDWNDK